MRTARFSGNAYYPFGMMMPHPQNTQPGGHSFGFQGQLTDDELHGDQNSYAFKARIHDPRIGRFMSIDPLFKELPYQSPYVFSENRIVDSYELEGKERDRAPKTEINGKGQITQIKTARDNALDHGEGHHFSRIKETSMEDLRQFNNLPPPDKKHFSGKKDLKQFFSIEPEYSKKDYSKILGKRGEDLAEKAGKDYLKKIGYQCKNAHVL